MNVVVLQLGQIEGDNPEEIKKQRAIKGLLNKITPDKFEKILNDIISVGYETEQTESGLIDQVCILPMFCLSHYAACLLSTCPALAACSQLLLAFTCLLLLLLLLLLASALWLHERTALCI